MWRWMFLVVLMLCVACEEGTSNDGDVTDGDPLCPGERRDDGLCYGDGMAGEQAEIRPFDILFMVDNTSSMCEEQGLLTEGLRGFLETLGESWVAFHIGAVNSDMTDFVNGTGTLRQGPGSYVANAGSCDQIPDTSFCTGKTLPPYLTPDDKHDIDASQILVDRRDRGARYGALIRV